MKSIPLAKLIGPKTTSITLEGGTTYTAAATINRTADLAIKVVGGDAAPVIQSTTSGKAPVLAFARGTLIMQRAVWWDLTRGGVGMCFNGAAGAVLDDQWVEGGHFIDAKEWDVIIVRGGGTVGRLKKYFAFLYDLHSKRVRGCRRVAFFRNVDCKHSSQAEALLRWQGGWVGVFGGTWDNRKQINPSGKGFKQAIQARGDGVIYDAKVYGHIDCGALTQADYRKFTGLLARLHLRGVELIGEVNGAPGTLALVEDLDVLGRDNRGGSGVIIHGEAWKLNDRPPARFLVRNSGPAEGVTDKRPLLGGVCVGGPGNWSGGVKLPPSKEWSDKEAAKIEQLAAQPGEVKV